MSVGVILAAALQNPYVRSFLIVLAVLGGLFTWHKVDKSSAVRRAVAEYVADVELTAARAELEEYRRRREVAAAANRILRDEIERANGEAEAAARELEDYVSTVAEICVVRPDVADRLRSR